VQRGYGSMGKAKEDFYDAIRALPSHVLEHIKNAMVWDSRISKSIRSGQNIFPDRHGRDDVQLAPEAGSKKKKKRSRAQEDVSFVSTTDMFLESPPLTFEHMTLQPAVDVAPLISPGHGSASSTQPAGDDMNIYPMEAEERVRNLKAARLADAVAHPSFQALSAEQQHVIKDLWVQSLIGSGSISHI
jgi:hypothetical protein